jgi:DNA replication protein DnaC
VAAILTPEYFRKFTDFHVSAMGAKIKEICECEDGRYDGYTFEEKVKMAIDAEIVTRQSNKLGRLVDEAHFSDPGACVEELMYLEGRSLSKDRILRLADCGWVSDHRTMLIIAPSGAGKSYLAQALGVSACRAGHQGLYRRLHGMLMDIGLAREQSLSCYKEELERYSTAELLILDDFLTTPVTVAQCSDLVDVVAARENHAATVIVSQIEPEQWYLRIKGEVMADNILSRLVKGSINIRIKGPDMRDYLASAKPEL